MNKPLSAREARVAAHRKAERAERRRYRAAVAAIEKRSAGTAQTVVNLRLAESPLDRLRRRKSLTIWEFVAADEILHAYRTSVGLPASRDPGLGIPPPERRPDAADEMSARRMDMLESYRTWRRELNGKPSLVAAMAVLIDEKPLRQIEREHHWRNGASVDYLASALRHFAALRGNTPRGARGW